MPRIFIRVGNTYAAKNKLCKSVIDNLSKLDCTLHDNEKDVKALISDTFHNIALVYVNSGGKAAIPNQNFYIKNKGFCYIVADTIAIYGEEVKELPDMRIRGLQGGRS